MGGGRIRAQSGVQGAAAYETGGIGLIPLVGTVNGLPGSPSWPAEPFILD